jgi:hypothetical protein
MGVIDTIKDAVMMIQNIDCVELYQKILDRQSDPLSLFGFLQFN